MNRTTRRAYTLIEVIVVVGILAAVALFVLPTYQLILSQLELNTAVSQVSDYLRESEQKTVTEQVQYGMTFTLNANTVPRFTYNATNGTKTVTSTITLPSYIQISQVNLSNNTDIRFTTSGAPNVSGSIVLKDTVRNRSRRIDIRPSGAILDNTAEF